MPDVYGNVYGYCGLAPPGRFPDIMIDYCGGQVGTHCKDCDELVISEDPEYRKPEFLIEEVLKISKEDS